MSYEYDQYLKEHKENIIRGLKWMEEYLPASFIDGKKMAEAQLNAENHDESKFSKDEYDAYDAYFYGGNRSYAVEKAFDLAWLHHQHNNPHHWQYWCLVDDDPSPHSSRALDMPLEYIYEMIADWWSFSWKNNNLMTIFSWYDEHYDYIQLSKTTRITVDMILTSMFVQLVAQLRLEHPDQEIAQPLFFMNRQEQSLISAETAKKIIAEPMVMETDNSLSHHGIKDQKWGIRNGPPYPLGRIKSDFTSPNKLLKHMNSFAYTEFDRLQSAEETEKLKSGSCHDQVMYELKQLRKLGIKPDAKFIIEYDPETNQGGTTHSFVYYKDGDNIVWFENAWEDQKGLHKFESEQALEDYIRKNWKTSDNQKYTELEFSDFKESKHKAGESLQELVNICLEAAT